MSFDARETSIADGQPIRLYQFQRGPLRFGYTSADRPITHNSIVFRSLPGGVSDDGIRQTGEASADKLTLTVPADSEIPLLFRGMPPSEPIGVTLFDLHYGDDGFIVAWVGDVTDVNPRGLDHAELICQPLSSTMERTGLRLSWSRNCPHSLYDNNCRVVRSAFRINGTVQTITGSSITVSTASAKADGWFAGGYVEWNAGSGVLDRRDIESHSSSTLVLLGGTRGLRAGLEVALYPGCTRDISACVNKFANLPNYGGSPFMPGKSPFDGTPVF